MALYIDDAAYIRRRDPTPFSAYPANADEDDFVELTKEMSLDKVRATAFGGESDKRNQDPGSY